MSKIQLTIFFGIHTKTEKKDINIFIFGDLLLYSHNPCVCLSSGIVRRNWMLVTV